LENFKSFLESEKNEINEHWRKWGLNQNFSQKDTNILWAYTAGDTPDKAIICWSIQVERQKCRRRRKLIHEIARIKD